MISTQQFEQANSYEVIKPLNKEGTALLCRTLSTGDLFVQKKLQVYDYSIFKYLMDRQPKGIPKIYSIHADDNTLTLTEEYIEGSTLNAILEEAGPFSPQEGVEILKEICDILAPLHALNPPIIHRDIKPSNILLGNNGQIYLLDFDAATKYASGKDQDTVLIGTTGYAAPEQYGFKASEPRADIYALGRLAQDVFIGEHVSPENYTGPYQSVIERCLKLEPSERFKNAATLKKAFTTYGKHRWYIPPGFRSQKPINMAIATIGYIIAFLMFSSFPTGQKVIETGGDFIALLIIVCEFLFVVNYMGIQNKLPFTSSFILSKRLIGIAIYMIIIFLVLAFLANILAAYGIIILE